MLPHQQIQACLQEAVAAVLPDADRAAVLVRPCPDPKFGDYQTNALMSLAKEREMNPRQLATDVLAKLDVTEWCEKVEIAGAGFLNFRLKTAAITHTLQSAARGEHLFFEKTKQPRTVVVDFSSPNVAKPMHVGHIRSTILGDCLARTLRLLGHHVITDNHIGDWGTQFGKLIVGWSFYNQMGINPMDWVDPIGELEKMYKLVNAANEGDQQALDYINSRLSPDSLSEKIHDKDSIANLARSQLVKLQQGSPTQVQIWKELIKISQKQFDEIYSRLGVKFDNAKGESDYNDRLKPLVEELLAKGIARESEGAIAIFFDHIPQLKDQPVLIRKSDGGFNYMTTDLATLAYRVETWHPDEIIYVTDGRQQLHFQQLFAIFRRWHPEAQVKLAHVWFGSILGDNNTPFRTRSGDTIKLADLLDQAEEHAFKTVSEKNLNLPESARREIARLVGLGAVKYADLLPNRQSDYVFSWDKMLALTGNTAPYLQYAYARIRSIFRKGEVEHSNTQISTIGLSTPEELTLARHLLNFGLTLEAVADDYRPNFLCNYLYDLAGHFSRFFENCPVLKAEPDTRVSRLALCALTAHVLKQGLEVLGIEVLEQM